ncbi:MAG: helix-turn-helix transcriptional regulator [Elusimicrobiota bacterium]
MKEYTIESWSLDKPKIIPVQIGEAIGQIMRAKHMTQAELSKKLRRTPARISQLLNGKCGSNLERLIPFLDELGYEVVIRSKNHWTY